MMPTGGSHVAAQCSGQRSCSPRWPHSCIPRTCLRVCLRPNCVKMQAVYTVEEGVKEFVTFTPPVIDISDVLVGRKPSTQTVQQVKAACEDTGFFFISGHQCTPGAVNAIFEASRPFFDLPKSRKLEYVVSGMRAGRGYEISPEHQGYGQWLQDCAEQDEKLAALLQSHPEASTREGIMAERFLCGPTAEPVARSMGRAASGPTPHGRVARLNRSQAQSLNVSEDSDRLPKISEAEMKELEEVFFSPNVWPEEAPLLQPCMESMYQRFTDVAEALLQVFAVALEAPPAFFRGKTSRHHSTMQVSNYSSLAQWPQGPDACMRKKAHVDSGTLTILTSDDWLNGAWQAGDGGLQLLNSRGVWQEVAVPRGALLVNIGGLLTHWTSGRWKSTLHRVTNPNQSKFDPLKTAASCVSTRRRSLAYFHKVNIDAVVSPDDFPSCAQSSHTHAHQSGRGAPPLRAMHLTRQGLLHKYRHLSAEEASAAYHAELAAVRNQNQGPN